MPVFVELVSPTDDELHAFLQPLTTQLMKLLTRRRLLVFGKVANLVMSPLEFM